MPDPPIFVGNWGHYHTTIVKDKDGAVVSIADAIIMKQTFRDPSGNETTVDALRKTDGLDGAMRYRTTRDDEIDDEAGEWIIYSYAEFADCAYYTTREEYTVYEPGSV